MEQTNIDVKNKEALTAIRPGLPAALALNGRQIFVIYYIQGRQVQQKFFNFSGTLKEAVERAKKHCEVMGLRWLRLDPFISDLDADERFRTENS